MFQFVRAFKGISHAHAVRGEIETGGSEISLEAVALATRLMREADPLFSSGSDMAGAVNVAVAGKLLRGEIKMLKGSPQDVARAAVELMGGFGNGRVNLTVPRNDGNRPEDWIG